MRMKRYKKIIDIILIAILILLITITSINSYILDSTKNQIIDLSGIPDSNEYIVLVLGASVRQDTVSLMLKDRLDKGIEIYNSNNNLIVLASGDGVAEDYNEIKPMYNYLIENNIPDTNIITDSYGISTYDSLWRLKNVYGYDKVIIVTQEYHLYRAIYIANRLDIDVYGIRAKEITYKNQEYRELREILARTKDYFKTIFKPKAKFNYK